MVLISIIIGLSIAEVLTAIADTLTKKNGQQFSWLHLVISLGIFIILLQIWWESWELQEISKWTFPHLLLFISIPVLLFIISRILNPGREYSGNLDSYYFDNAAKFWFILGAGVIIGNTFRTIIYGSELFIMDNFSAIPILIICVTLGISKNKIIHKILVPVMVTIILLDVLLINFLIS